MTTLDTNVLVRFLVKDDIEQHACAVRFLESARATDALFVPLTVVLELEWVLRSRYAVTKAVIVRTFVRLLETKELVLQDEQSIERALSLFDDHTADFADCLHLALAITHDKAPLTTFDRKAARMPQAVLLED